jgi:HSP20 family protein
VAAPQNLIQKFQELQDRIHTLMEEAVLGSRSAHGGGYQAQWSPAVDVFESKGEFVLTMEVPGIERDDVDLQLKEGVLYLRGRRIPCTEPSKQTYYRLERPSGSFERRFSLPEEIDPAKITAQLNDGVLTVTLPKRRRPLQPFKVEVKKA